MLAHDIRSPESAMAAATKWTSVMGIENGSIWDDGGLGLFAVIPREGDGVLAGIAGFHMERNQHRLWNGEYFYALGTAWHGKGLMSEVADHFCEILKVLPDLGVIYAWYWDMINAASGRVLRRTGLIPNGRILLRDEYDRERCHVLFDYDLWRLTQARDEEHRANVGLQVARRAGAFVAEGAITMEEALGEMAKRSRSGQLSPSVLSMLDRAIATPGMAMLELRGDSVRGETVGQRS